MGIKPDGIAMGEHHRNTEPTPISITDGIKQSVGQLRLAYCLAESHSSRLMHVHGVGWYYWDKKRWTYDNKGKAKQAVYDVLRTEWKRAFNDDKLVREIRAANAAPGVRGILELAAALEPFAFTVGDLDADRYLLNTANGTLDLRTMELMEHDPSDRQTWITRAAYDPSALSEEWETFLEQILPDPEVRAYLARLVGSSLIGVVHEQTFNIATGIGANGKGVTYKSVMFALGDYSHMAQSDLFMSSKSDANAASPALMSLLGKRFVVCSETEQERKLNASLMKNLTGGDLVTARALHKDPVTFEPSHTVLLVTNYLPKVAGNDPAVWRRMRVIPFDVVIPEPEWDKKLGDRLQLSADAILTWAVAGYRDYKVNGMNPPDAVLAKTKEYRKNSDAVARFLDAECDAAPGLSITVSDLFDAWVKWSTDDGAEPMSKNALMEELGNRGFPAAKVGSTRLRKGLNLSPEEFK